MKFIGSLSQLKTRFSDLGVTGAWWCGQGYHELRTDDGVVVYWWPSTKTILFHGRRVPAAKLKFRFREAADQFFMSRSFFMRSIRPLAIVLDSAGSTSMTFEGLDSMLTSRKKHRMVAIGEQIAA